MVSFIPGNSTTILVFPLCWTIGSATPSSFTLFLRVVVFCLIAASLRLRAKGHLVTIIEKHPDLGVIARVFKKNGFTFDGGPTVITAPYLINELFDLFKKDPKDYIKLTPLKIWYQFIFEDKTKFNYSGNESEMKDQIEKINIKDVKGYERLVSFTKKIFDKGFTELADVPFDKPFVMMQQLPALLKLKSYKSVYSLVSSYIQSEKLRRMLSMHPLLVGGLSLIHI